jgi:hypothetical protein
VDIASILNELWRRRRWVAAGAIVVAILALSVVFRLPSFEKKSDTSGVAATDVLVDTRSSALGSIAIDVDELTTRAAVYANIISTTAVRERIARLVDGAPDEIGIVDTSTGTPGSTEGQTGERTPQPSGGLKIGASTLEAHPAVKLEAFAPTPRTAKRLANASATALISYVAGVQEARAIPPRERVVLRQLGPPQTVLLVDGPDYLMAIALFIGLMLAWCLVVLIASRTAEGLRELRDPAAPRAVDEGNLLIGLWDRAGADARLEELRGRRQQHAPRETLRGPRHAAPPSRHLRP